MQFFNFPEFLRRNARWAVWRYVQEPGRDKPSKPPFNPTSGRMVDVTAPNEWLSYDECVAAYGNGEWWNGIGFLIEKRLNVTVVDLDYKDNRPPAIQTLHERIYHKLNTYTEFSPSGQGLHVVSHGVVPTARKYDVEVYSDLRFMTVTGNVLHNVPIADNQISLEKLVEEIAGERKARKPLDMNAPQTAEDDAVIARGYAAQNGEKFRNLWEGNWQFAGYPSQSEADFALVNMLCYYTANVDQIRRLFFKSALGERDKLIERPDLLNSMISAGFDRLLPDIDISALQEQFKAMLAKQEEAKIIPAAVTPKGVALDAIPLPPGALGAICQWYLDAAPYPAPEIALAGGLGFMAGLCGAGWNVEGDPLNLFLLLTAPSAVGKGVTTGGAVRLLRACNAHPDLFTGSKLSADWMNDIMGPSVIASGAALTKHLSHDFMSTISIQEEFGVELEKLNSSNASIGMLQLRQMYLKLAATGTLGKDIWSDKDQNTKVRNGIAFTLLGESVPERIYDNLQAIQVADGFLGRLLLIEMPTGRLTFQKFAYQAQPDNRLVEYIIRMGAFATERCRMQQPLNVGFTPEADALLEHHRDKWRRMHVGPNLPLHAPIWGRCAVKVARVAALIAVGKNFQNPIIEVEDVEWAINLVERGTQSIVNRFDNGEIGTEDQDRLKIMQRVLKNYVDGKFSRKSTYYRPDLHSAGQMPKGFIHALCSPYKSFNADKFAFDRCFKMLVESGVVAEVRNRDDYGDKKFKGVIVQIVADALERGF